MSENSLSETYLNGMVHIIQPGDTPEYLEDLRKRGFITVSFEFDESIEKEYANNVVTSIDTTTDANNYADGPAKQVTFIDSMTDTTNCSVTINNSNTTDTTGTDTTEPQEYPYPGRPIAGYHMVRYGETQEYLESLAGYILMYSEDNPPEEGKLTVAKPNAMPEWLKDYATNVVYDEYGNFISCSVEGLITLAEDGTVAQTTADINNTADTTDPNNWADGPSYPVNPETKDRINGEDIVVTIIDYHHGRMLGDMDPPGRESTPPDVTTIEDLTPEDIVLIPVSNDFLQKLEEAKSIRQRLAERSKPVAFVSTLDAETEAVTSVQVACAEDDGWRTIGVLNNPDGIDWKYQAGNLTGSGAASVVWHAQELGALGVWTDGTDNWTGIAGWFDENWTMLGCGDFDGDRKDSVLMSLNGGLFYSVDLDGTLTSLGGLNWSGWEFGAAGDFAGDGKDDIVLFHKGLNCVILLADGNADDYASLGQLDASDWNIAGAGDFDADGRDDLLVRQTSTGLAGAYAGGDMNQWSVIDTTGEYCLA